MKRILIIGSSHAVFAQKCISRYFSNDTNHSFDIISVHGRAFMLPIFGETNSEQLLSFSKDGTISFLNGTHYGIKLHWTINSSDVSATECAVNIHSYDAILLLNPLFLASKRVLECTVNEGYLCTSIGTSNDREKLGKALATRFKSYYLERGINPISKHQYFECYKFHKQLDMMFLSFFSEMQVSHKTFLLPHPPPPLWQNACEYAKYYLSEQKLVSAWIYNNFGISSIELPNNIYFETESGIACFDAYHQPCPDPHHPSPEYYQEILKTFLSLK